MKCVGLQYLEAIRKLKASGFQLIKTVYLSFVLDEEISDHNGAEKFANSNTFAQMNVGIVLDEREIEDMHERHKYRTAPQTNLNH
ncbi:hypothetical protein RJ640_000432 [Escallonia rubra]|uniref:Uncharacterized protein n=1 Tax=Escallonia rubra TaxID=112253 RepID=A0AA88R8H9_9ASTE|nr:hypothetical protein RJ640_000432 [Escallonia rubra]